jgi:amidohydrolase
LFESLSASRSLDLQIRRKTYTLDTSFEIDYKHGDGGGVVVFNAEYDALPGIGHACGHNLIATSSIAAFIATIEAMKAFSASSSGQGYTVRLLGTPAEEGGGGKLKLIDAGAYKGVDACLMVHPVTLGHNDASDPGVQIAGPESLLANNKIKVKYTGSTAHAAGAPWEGINALDAVVSAYVNISLLRQQILPTQRIHGIVSNGGERPNVIPNSTTLQYYIRSPDTKSLNALTDRVFKCFEAAATATGCQVEFEWLAFLSLVFPYSYLVGKSLRWPLITL